MLTKLANENWLQESRCVQCARFSTETIGDRITVEIKMLRIFADE